MTLKEKNADYYRRNRDKVLRRVAAYRAKNRVRVLRWQRAYAKRNPRIFRASYRRYYENPANRLTVLWQHAAYRGKPIEKRLLYVLKANPPKKCGCCRKRLDYSCGKGKNPLSPSLDRWDNAKGYTLDNTHVVCYRCNELKRDATVAELKAIVRYMS